MNFQPQNPNFATEVRDSFSKQHAMTLIGAEVVRVEPGEVDIALPFRADLTQQDGFIHAGMIATVADSACGYAAFTLMPPNSNVLAVEFKLNLLRPAKGSRFIAAASVLKAGRTLTVVRADVFAEESDRKLIATMTGTMMCLPRT
ncbi:MAG TPA: PaaI family thioesterase [Pyrinomonadaceae bacterium]